MTNNKAVAAQVDKAKELIIDDMTCGIVPLQFANFNELYEYVDANEYLIPGNDMSYEALGEFANQVQAALDLWIAEGI